MTRLVRRAIGLLVFFVACGDAPEPVADPVSWELDECFWVNVTFNADLETSQQFAEAITPYCDYWSLNGQYFEGVTRDPQALRAHLPAEDRMSWLRIFWSSTCYPRGV